MSNAPFVPLFAVMLAGLGAGTILVLRPSTPVGQRRMLFTLMVLGTLMPYAIHGLRVYGELTTVAPGSGLAIGRYPTLDRWIMLILLLIVLLTLAGWIASRNAPLAAVGIPIIMAIAYIFGLLPYAVRHRPQGTSSHPSPTSWLMWTLLIGVVLITATARRLSWNGRGRR